MKENKDALPVSFTRSPLPVLQRSWKSILVGGRVGGREGGSNIDRKKVQKVGEEREKEQQTPGQIRGEGRRGLQRGDEGLRSSGAPW